MNHCLGEVLKPLAEFSPVRWARTPTETVRLIPRGVPCVVLVDLAGPDREMFTGARRINRARRRAAVIFLAESAPVGWVAQAVALGASGFLGGCSDCRDVVEALRAARRGDSYFSPCAARIVAAIASGRSDLPLLRDRERVVLEFVSEGKVSKEIAERLGLTTKAVDSIRNRLMRKTGTRTATALVRYACEQRLIPCCGGARAEAAGRRRKHRWRDC